MRVVFFADFYYNIYMSDYNLNAYFSTDLSLIKSKASFSLIPSDVSLNNSSDIKTYIQFSQSFSNENIDLSLDDLTTYKTWNYIESSDEWVLESNPLIVQFTTSSSDQEVSIPLLNEKLVDIDWGDGIVDYSVTFDNPTHTYSSSGTYTAKVSGTASFFGSTGSSPLSWRTYVSSIISFGEIGITSLNRLLGYMNKDVPVPSTLPAGVTSINGMFLNNALFNQPINTWDVSSVEDMQYTFDGANSFNQYLGNWDLGSVLYTRGMFRNATSFNQDIGGWNTSNITWMSEMFRNADSFDQDISSWDFSGISETTNLSDFMRDSSGFSTENYDKLLIAWSSEADEIISSIVINMGTVKYTPGGLAESARQNLIDNYSWNITDGGPASLPS